MLDELPDIPGFADVWGTSAHTCPYCDGFEHRDEV
jgi:thioredoxin reductase